MVWERNIDLTYNLQQKYSLHNSPGNKTHREFAVLVKGIPHGSQELELRREHGENLNKPVKFIATTIWKKNSQIKHNFSNKTVQGPWSQEILFSFIF